MGSSKLGADDPVSLFPSEAPQYEALTDAVSSSWDATTDAFLELRAEWLTALGFDGETRTAALWDLRTVTVTTLRGDGQKRLPTAVRRMIDAAIDRFLRLFAGNDRTAQGFAADQTEDGILQQSEVIAWSVGFQRGSELLSIERNPALSAAQRNGLLRDAFARMSEDGRLRFETRLDEVRQAMLDGFERGDNPIAIARRLSADLDAYHAGRLRTIVRTEMGIAALAGEKALFGQAGVHRVKIIGDPNTDAACTSRIGRVFLITDLDNLPLFHPNCFCDFIPADEE